MNLTESKLKQMILEAMKGSSFRSFGIPTPDEKLTSDLGGEMFDKIQSLDPEQADIMKQSFDPNYPRDIEQESLNTIFEEFGFNFVEFKYNAPTRHDGYNHRTWYKGKPNKPGTVSLSLTYNLYDSIFNYKIIETTKTRFGSNSKTIVMSKIEVPPMFKLSLLTDQDLRDADSIMLSKEKQTIEKALEQYR